jgi:DNA/RNA endonuclease YhcR with UshA esterase domain
MQSGGAMERTVFAVLISGWIALGTGMPALAHHSFAAAYDLQQPVTVHGVITNVLLRNPHSWFLLDVRDESGQVHNWAFEAGTPSGMIRNGYKPNVIKAGAEVTIKGFRARDASRKMGMLRELVTADGQVFGLFGPQETR